MLDADGYLPRDVLSVAKAAPAEQVETELRAKRTLPSSAPVYSVRPSRLIARLVVCPMWPSSVSAMAAGVIPPLR